jgi:hypothetical protein
MSDQIQTFPLDAILMQSWRHSSPRCSSRWERNSGAALGDCHRRRGLSCASFDAIIFARVADLVERKYTFLVSGTRAVESAGGGWAAVNAAKWLAALSQAAHPATNKD